MKKKADLNITDADVGRFFNKIDFQDRSDCWLWMGSKHKDGYGHIKIKGKMLLSHRIMYFTFWGPIPPEKEIDHLCRNRLCVNPYHMEAVTHKENILRDDSPQAKNARKTRCPKGHPLNGENGKPFPSNPKRRNCRKCIYLANKERRERAKKI